MDYSISTINLTKKFGDFTAVDHINLHIAPGEICAFLGPNGAGKSTTIRMLCGILEPSSGSANILGYNLATHSEQTKQFLGYMSQKFSLYHDLTVMENMDFYAGIYTIPRKNIKTRMQELTILTELTGQENTLVAHLSTGYKQRLGLACAIISDPAIIFLDEPTSGVSPAARRSFFNIIQKQAARGKTIIVSTHFMDEAERCGKIAFFNEGHLLALDSPDHLKSTIIQGYLFKLDTEKPWELLETIKNMPDIIEASIHGQSIHVQLSSPEQAKQLEKATGVLPLPIEPTLEDVFLALARHRGGKNL